MKSPFLQFLLILVAGYAAHNFAGFWVISIVALGIGLFFNYPNSTTSFIAGFLAAGLLWAGYATYIDFGNQGILSEKIGEVFKVGRTLLILITGIAGGLIGGFGALTGTLVRKIFS